MSTLLMTGAPAVAPTALTQDGHLGLGEAIVFGVVALVTVACGIGVLTAKRAVNAAINMIGIMISLAVLYIVNESPFMGITQVVVYTGAVVWAFAARSAALAWAGLALAALLSQGLAWTLL